MVGTDPGVHLLPEGLLYARGHAQARLTLPALPRARVFTQNVHRPVRTHGRHPRRHGPAVVVPRGVPARAPVHELHEPRAGVVIVLPTVGLTLPRLHGRLRDEVLELGQDTTVVPARLADGGLVLRARGGDEMPLRAPTLRAKVRGPHVVVVRAASHALRAAAARLHPAQGA
eukprot:278511-Rhodomonas_salina.1